MNEKTGHFALLDRYKDHVDGQLNSFHQDCAAINVSGGDNNWKWNKDLNQIISKKILLFPPGLCSDQR